MAKSGVTLQKLKVNKFYTQPNTGTAGCFVEEIKFCTFDSFFQKINFTDFDDKYQEKLNYNFMVEHCKR